MTNKVVDISNAQLKARIERIEHNLILLNKGVAEIHSALTQVLKSFQLYFQLVSRKNKSDEQTN